MCVHRVSGRGHRVASMPHHAIIRSEGDCFANSSRADSDEISPISRSDRNALQPHELCRVGADRVPGIARGEVRRHHHQAGGLERARPTDRVERILQVVGAGGHVHAGRSQCGDRGEPTGHRRRSLGPGGTGSCAAARRRRCRPARPVRRSRAGACGSCIPRLTQWLAVTGCSNPSEHHAWRGRPGRARRHRASRRCAGRRRHPDPSAVCRKTSVASADRASPSRCGQPPTRSAPASSASRSSARWSAPSGPMTGQPHRATISSVDDVGDAPADLGQRLDAAQTVLRRGVGVACGRPVKPLAAISRAARSARSIDLVDVEEVPVRAHRVDRPHQVAGRVLDPLGEERLVEVGVRLDRGRQQELAVEIDHVGVPRLRSRADLGDASRRRSGRRRRLVCHGSVNNCRLP